MQSYYFNINNAYRWLKERECSPEGKWNFKELQIPLVKNFDIVKKRLGNRGLYLNEYGTSRLAMNYIATKTKLWNNVDYPSVILI